MKCPICDSKKDLVRGKDFAPIRVGKRQFTVEVDIDKCACGEIFVEGSSAIAAEKLVASHLAKHGHMDQEIFRFTRKALGFTAAALAEKMDVSETTISRWENDKNEIPRSAAVVMTLMALNDEAIPVVDALELLSKPRKIQMNKLTAKLVRESHRRSSAVLAQELTAQLLAEEAAAEKS